MLFRGMIVMCDVPFACWYVVFCIKSSLITYNYVPKRGCGMILHIGNMQFTMLCAEFRYFCQKIKQKVYESKSIY